MRCYTECCCTVDIEWIKVEKLTSFLTSLVVFRNNFNASVVFCNLFMGTYYFNESNLSSPCTESKVSFKLSKRKNNFEEIHESWKIFEAQLNFRGGRRPGEMRRY